MIPHTVPAVAILLGPLLAAPAMAQDEPPLTLDLWGTVRDFRERTADGGHPDFERQPLFGFGHYAGNVALELGEHGKPVFTGNGRKIIQEWRDAAGRNIAPHMFNAHWSSGGGGGGATVTPGAATTAILKDSNKRDAFEVTWLSADLNPDGTSTWTYRMREVPGKGKDLSHWNIRLDPSHEVLGGTTPGYDFGVDGSTGYFGIKWDVTDGFEQGDFTIVLAGHFQGADTQHGVLAKGGKNAVTAKMFVPGTTPVGEDVDDAGDGTLTLVIDPALGDVEGQPSMADSGGIQSADTFDQWFRDVPGVNLSSPLSLIFERQDDGTYVFDDQNDCLYSSLGGFFPLDGQLFGSSGGSPNHNFHFTYELHTEFTYDESAEQFFQFTGDDDVWVFIDGRLAIDIGGVHGQIDQSIALDRMGLQDGQDYKLDFFFAERHRTQSNFRITTNIPLRSNNRPALMSAAFD